MKHLYSFWISRNKPDDVEYQYFVVSADSWYDADRKADEELKLWADRGFEKGHVTHIGNMDKVADGTVFAL